MPPQAGNSPFDGLSADAAYAVLHSQVRDLRTWREEFEREWRETTQRIEVLLRARPTWAVTWGFTLMGSALASALMFILTHHWGG